jgi:N4-gp56 family major capsid protein
MATTLFGTNNALAVKLYSKRLFREALKATYAYKFMGEGQDALCQLLNDTSKSAGDKITYGLRMQLSGDGVVGDGTLEGNEEALVTYSDALVIDQLRNAVRSGGKMSEQRIPWSVREEALMGLRDWWAARIDYWFFNQLAGMTPTGQDTRYTGLQAVITPTTAQWLNVGQTTGSSGEGSIGSGNTFVIGQFDKAVATAKTLSPVIRPIRVDGNDMYVSFLHPYQVYSLRSSTASGQWLDIQKAAMTGGDVEDNPIFTGALGVYNNVVIHEAFRIPSPASNVRRAVFAGAQAAVFAVGQKEDPEKPNWVEQLFDYGNQLGVAGGMIAGLKKTQFNSADFGTIVLSSYAAAPT